MHEVEERIREITENEIRDMIRRFGVIVKTGKKWIHVVIERDNEKETLKLPFKQGLELLHVSVNRKYLGIIEGRARFAFIKAIGVCKTDYGSWELRIIK